MCNWCAVISGIQSHIFREMTKALLNLPENGWQRRSVIDVRWFHMYIDNHIVLTVYRAMLTHQSVMDIDCEARNALRRISYRMMGVTSENPLPAYGTEKLSWFRRLFQPTLKEVKRIDR